VPEIIFIAAMAWILSVYCAGAVSGPAGGGRVIYVSPSGQPGAPGAAEAPLGGVQEALDRAVAGDTVHLRAGLYRERVRFKHSGEYQRPVVLEGEPGAVLDGSEPVTLEWEPRDDIAPGVYAARAPFWSNEGEAPWAYGLHVPGAPFFPFTLTAEGKIVTALDERKVDPATQEYAEWHWPAIFRNGIRPFHRRETDSGWEGVKALVMYRRQEQELLIRFQDNRDPNATAITVSPTDPVVTIQGVDRCVVRGLAIRNGAKGVYIENSLGSVVEHCTIGPADFGVMLRRGADRCTVRFNEIFMDPFAGASPRLKASWSNWEAHKVGGFSDRDGILMLSTKGGHQIHDNYIHDHWDGIEDWITGAWQPGSLSEETGCDHNLNIHSNLISNISDDGLEPNGEEVNCQWHDNIVEGCICGFRIKAPRLGPMYAYRNIFFNNKEDYRNFGEDPQRPAHVYVYHNTSTANAAVVHLKVTGIGTPNYQYYNNLFWCKTGQWISSESTAKPNWRADHNVYVFHSDSALRQGSTEQGMAEDDRDPGGQTARALWREAKEAIIARHQDAHSRWVEDDPPGFVDFAAKDVSLTAQSPAREQGADLSRLFDEPLPGCPPGYFLGDAPDAGAAQFGDPMPRLPRRPEEVNRPPAGTWPPPVEPE
jgi:hypothetical protein